MTKKLILTGLLIALLVGCSTGKENSSSSTSSSSTNDITSGSSSSSTSSSNTSDITSGSSSSNSESGSSSSSFVDIETNLDIPNIQINNETGVVTWEEIEGATHYNCIINDGEALTTTSRSIQLKNQENVSVQASSDNACSDFSKAVTFYDTSDVVVGEEKEVKVYFHNSGINAITVTTGHTVSRPTNPTKVNYTFDDWYEDPFYQVKFDFSKPIVEKTIVYANWIPTDLIKDTYFWIKASPKITSSVMSSTSSSSDWKFIPLKVNEGQTAFKEFYATIQVTGASSSNPAEFIFMDGFNDDKGRSYWKDTNNSNFKIESDGLYDIYFSLQHEYNKGVYGTFVSSTNGGIATINPSLNGDSVSNTPVVDIDNLNNIASWTNDTNAIGYEVVIDNGNIQRLDTNSVSINKGSHISVRSVYENYKSNWSIPKANINYVYENDKSEEDKYVYVYFQDSGLSSTRVEKGSSVNSIELEGDEIKTFAGWYLEPSLTNKVTFPYTVNENVTFYPKWEYASDIYTRDYYYLIDNNNKEVDGFVWNYDNYDFYEYELKNVQLSSGTYYVKSLDQSITYETFTISSNGEYSIYFSEDNIWTNQGTSRHVYVAEVIHEKVIYFTNSRDSWMGKDVYAYVWSSSTKNNMGSWPGNKMTYSHSNSQGQSVYKISVDLSKYDSIIFSVEDGSSRQQTIDIVLTGATNNAYYVSGGKDSSGKYPVGTWTYNG